MAEQPVTKPLLVFDGDCSFCRRWVGRWQGITGDRVGYEPYQQAAQRFPQIPVENFKHAAQLIEPDGRISSGARAAFRTLDLAGYRHWPLWAYDHLPGFAVVTNLGYRIIADHRNLFDRLDRILIGPHATPSTYFLSRWLFMRALGIIYLIAFISYWSQIDGLIGSKGILPVAPWLDAIRQHYGVQRFWLLPTLAWINASDSALHWMCGIGVALSVLLIIGIAPVLMLVLLWVFYLSLVCAGQVFLGFQWDALLLETGLVAIFFAPWELLPRHSRQPRPMGIPLWLLRWLAFRIMFLSGLVKLTYGDETWWNWTALDYHYFTQPIPTWTAWWMYQLPHWWHVISMGFMWYAELIAPFFIFGPRRMRILAFWSIVLFQLLIQATGNYGFFNILTMALCIPLVDDLFWPAWLRRAINLPGRPLPLVRWRYWPIGVTAPLAALILLVTGMQLVEAFDVPINWPRPMSWISEQFGPFRSVNSYGLFRVMTTKRPEIVIEGSNDGATWKAYEFKWKPGDMTRRPRFCAPHMPRLDWQMWFAALGNYQQNPWLMNFMSRLLEGTPPVLGLLENNPFPDHPPKYVRAVLYEYKFTDSAERRETGQWWKRELLGLYCPVLQRQPSRFDPDSLQRDFGL
ncbi:MAG TPA: lipase maturation factor family protein [Tepidisphaeraceae bacterium]